VADENRRAIRCGENPPRQRDVLGQRHRVCVRSRAWNRLQHILALDDRAIILESKNATPAHSPSFRQCW
jgi:hypothetical protein